MTSSDAVIVGGGLSGTSLACHLLTRPTGIETVTIVDPGRHGASPRSWAYWSTGDGLFDHVATRSWDQVHVVVDGRERRVDLAPYRYRLVESAQLHDVAARVFAARGGVRLVTGVASDVLEGEDQAVVLVGEERVSGRWVFDSRLRPGAAAGRLRFTGWEVETSDASFDVAAPTLFDFRTPQAGAARFVYVLPYSPTRALVEHTSFSPGPDVAGSHGHDGHDADEALVHYLTEVRGLRVDTVLAAECASLPLRTPGPRRIGRRTLAIGAGGGMVKASTGYGFTAIERDSAAIAASLARHGHPFDVPGRRPRHRYLDRVFLRLLATDPAAVERAFAAMFDDRSTQRSLRFLDEQTSLAEEAALVLRLPWVPFARAALSGRAGAGRHATGRTARRGAVTRSRAPAGGPSPPRTRPRP